MRLLNDFHCDIKNILRKRHVRTMLEALNSHEREGWEKWLQFEIVRYYIENGHEPYWEHSCDKNLQHKPHNRTKRIDLVYRKNNTNNDYYHGVEIKVMKCPQYSIKGMLSDLHKVSQIKTSVWKLRAVTGLSIYSAGLMEDTK